MKKCGATRYKYEKMLISDKDPFLRGRNHFVWSFSCVCIISRMLQQLVNRTMWGVSFNNRKALVYTSDVIQNLSYFFNITSFACWFYQIQLTNVPTTTLVIPVAAVSISGEPSPLNDSSCSVSWVSCRGDICSKSWLRGMLPMDVWSNIISLHFSFSPTCLFFTQTSHT